MSYLPSAIGPFSLKVQSCYYFRTMPRQNEKILVVDDEPALRDVISRRLEHWGYHVRAAAHVREADLAVRLPGSTPAETYLRGDLVIAAAQRVGADAVHPGYGFLSENADFAAAVLDAGLGWIGPPPKAIAAMGSKVEAKALLAEAGVPMLESWTRPDEVNEFPVLVLFATVLLVVFKPF